MKLVAFEPAHLRQLDPGTANLMPRPGVAFSLLDADRVLGCAGLVPMAGHAEAWALISDELRARPMILHRLVVRALRMLDDRWPTPLLAVVQTESRTARNWLERLGFRRNGRDANWVCYERNGTLSGGSTMADSDRAESC